MKPRITVVTLAVQDLEAAVAFYRRLGWTTEGIVGQDIKDGVVAFFDLPHGMKLALWPQQSLQNDTGMHVATPNNPTSFSLGYNVNSKEEVQEALETVREAGATILQESREREWGGWTAYFQDPDGHLWEIVYNPSILVES
jgi:catechol 2,3-dioxygenase-like lactoylglutathione lyase family enzyme